FAQGPGEPAPGEGGQPPAMQVAPAPSDGAPVAAPGRTAAAPAPLHLGQPIAAPPVELLPGASPADVARALPPVRLRDRRDRSFAPQPVSDLKGNPYATDATPFGTED